MRSRLADAIVRMAALLPEKERLALSRSWLARGPRSLIAALSASEGMRPHRIRAGPLRGWQIVTDLGSYRGYVLGTYEPEVSHALLSVVRPGMVAVDAGAHHGYFTLLMARAVGPSGKVFAFEANADNLASLRQTVRLNGLGHVWPQGYALSSRCGEAVFRMSKSSSMGRIMAQDKDDVKAGTVPTISLDEFADSEALPQVHVVKVDVEGHEVEVLRGMSRVMERWRPAILCECHGPGQLAAFREIVAGHGYQAVEIGRGEPVRLLACHP